MTKCSKSKVRLKHNLDGHTMNQTLPGGCSLPLNIVLREKTRKKQNMHADTVDDGGADSSYSLFEVHIC